MTTQLIADVGPGQQVDLKKLKRLNRVLMIARFLALVLRVSWAIVRHYPAQAGASVLVGLVLMVIVPVASPLACVALVVGVWWQVRRAGSRAQLNRCVGAVLGAVFRWRWPSQVHRAELDRLIMGRYRVPRLTAVTVDAVDWSHRGLFPSIGRLRTEVVPLDAQRPNEWPEIARRLQVRHRFATHSYRPSGETRFRVAFASAVLPDLAPFQGADWVARTLNRPDRVELGYSGNIDAPEPWMFWELDSFPHRMINGKTGGGKSTPMRCAQLHAVVTGAELFVLSGKRSGEFGWLKRRGLASIASTPPGWAHMMDYLWAEFERRQSLLEESGCEWWWQHPDIGHRLFVSVDELMLITGAATKDEFTPYRNLTAGRLTELAAASRSCGMHLDMATQYGVAQAGGASGSLMRFNLSGRMVVGASNGDGLKAAFDEPVDDHVATHLSGTVPGRCLYAQLNRHHGQHVTPGQIWNVTQDDAEQLAPAEPAHVIHDFDALAALQLLEQQQEAPANGRAKSGRNKR